MKLPKERIQGERMTKIRVYELARDLNMSNKGLMDRLNDMDIAVTSHMSSLDAQTVIRIKSALFGPMPETFEETRVKPTVIRRRRKPVPVEVAPEVPVEAEPEAEVATSPESEVVAEEAAESQVRSPMRLQRNRAKRLNPLPRKRRKPALRKKRRPPSNRR